MKIQVGGLSEGLHTYSFRIAPAELGLTSEFHEDVAVEATLEKTSRQLLLRASMTTTAEFACDRCVAPFTQKLGSHYVMYYLWDGEEATRMDPAEIQVISPGQTVLDIADDVRQTILLAVPLKHVCREDCRGLCPHCGKNLNEGPCGCRETMSDGRWDKLKELHKNNPNDAR